MLGEKKHVICRQRFILLKSSIFIVLDEYFGNEFWISLTRSGDDSDWTWDNDVSSDAIENDNGRWSESPTSGKLLASAFGKRWVAVGNTDTLYPICEEPRSTNPAFRKLPDHFNIL